MKRNKKKWKKPKIEEIKKLMRYVFLGCPKIPSTGYGVDWCLTRVTGEPGYS
jgi:ribosomal protein L32E